MYLNNPIFIFFKHITVEPSVFIFLIVYEWMKGLDTNLFLQKACRFNSTTEPDLSTPCDDERRGIIFVSDVDLKYHPIVVLSGVVVTMLATSWSDKVGRRRRPLIYWSILGQIFHTLSGCLHSYFWPWTPMGAVLSWTVLESISGGVGLMVAACRIYICDITDIESRTLRLGLLGTVKVISMILGDGGAGFILRTFGFFYSYSICFALSLCAFVVGSISIKDASISVEKKIGFWQIFNLKHSLVDSFKVVFSKNLGSKRIIVALLIVTYVLVIFTFYGESSLYYPYLRYRFGWDERTYSGFMFFKFLGSAFGMLFCSVILSKWLKIHDGLIGILAGIFDTAAMFTLLVATQIWQIYLIPFIDVFHSTAMTIGLSFVSKYYDPSELGRLNTVTAVLSLLIPLCYPTYNTIFQKTLDSFPNAFCLLSIVLDICMVFCFCGAYVLSKKFDQKKPSTVISKAPEEKSTLY